MTPDAHAMGSAIEHIRKLWGDRARRADDEPAVDLTMEGFVNTDIRTQLKNSRSVEEEETRVLRFW